MDVLRPHPTVKAHVTVILKNRVILGRDDSRILGGISQSTVVRPQLRTDGKTALVFDLPVAQLLPPRLDGEVGLTLRHDFLAGIGVLDDKVARVARHHHGLQRAIRPAADADHFGDINEMVFEPMAAVETCGASLLDHHLKVPVIGVAEHSGEVAAGPEFIARCIRPADLLKRSDVAAQSVEVLAASDHFIGSD